MCRVQILRGRNWEGKLTRVGVWRGTNWEGKDLGGEAEAKQIVFFLVFHGSKEVGFSWEGYVRGSKSQTDCPLPSFPLFGGRFFHGSMEVGFFMGRICEREQKPNRLCFALFPTFWR